MFLFLILLFVRIFAEIQAEDYQNLPQPVGTLVRVWGEGPPPFPLQSPSRIPPFQTPGNAVEEINYINAQWDVNITLQTVPFDTRTPVTEIIPSQPLHFVRFFAPASGTSPNGLFIVRSSEVRGLTPEQIQDKLALPILPTHIVNVDLPPSPDPATGKLFALMTGIAAPIEGYGNGGGLQSRFIVDFNGTYYFSEYCFFLGLRDHPQLIGATALSYQPMAGGGNSGHIAAYLDKFIPIPYSDLENVYTSLDYLNWTGFGPDPLQEALNQISPSRYEALAFIGMRNILLFANLFLDQCREECESKRCMPIFCHGRLWVTGVGEFGNQETVHTMTGFDYQTGGAVGGIDCQLCEDWLFGIGLAGLNSHLSDHHDEGSGSLTSTEMGLYVNYAPGCYFVDGLLSAGYHWSSLSREIRFLGVNRVAHGHPKGFDLGAHIQGGFDHNWRGFCFTPLARLSYLYVKDNHFREHGADSLNLHVRSFESNTLRSILGVRVMREILFCSFRIEPCMELGWAHNFFLDGKKIIASLIDLDDSFSVRGYFSGRNTFLFGGSFQTYFVNNMTGFIRYDLEIGDRFVSNEVKLGFAYHF